MNQPITCLLIDDDPEDHEIFRMAIDQTTLDVTCFYKKSYADSVLYIKTLDMYPPDFIFLDWYMPGFHGIKCLDAFKKIKKLAKSQFVVFSGAYSSDITGYLASAYNCKFLEKSDSIEWMASELKIILQSNRMAYETGF